MDRKIKVSIIQKPDPSTDDPYWRSGGFIEGISNCSRLEVRRFFGDKEYDIRKLPETDIIILLDNYTNKTPDRLIGIEKTSIPVFAQPGDIHDIEMHDRIPYHEKYKIDCYFNSQPKGVFYQYYPKKYTYHNIIYGLRHQLYQQVRPWSERIKDRILITGRMARRGLVRRAASRFLRKNKQGWQFVYLPHSAYYYYALRVKCRHLPYVEHVYDRDRTIFPKILANYCGSIVACSLFPVTKYLESMAAGSLTFMEITERNCGIEHGFKDGETAVFINEKNYKDRLQEYLNDKDNPKWEEIAAAGREWVMNNRTNDHAANKLADIMEEYIK